MSLFDEVYLQLAYDGSGRAGTQRQARYAAWAERQRLLAEARAARRDERRARRTERPVVTRPASAAAKMA